MKIAPLVFLMLLSVASACLAQNKIPPPETTDELRQSVSKLLDRYDVPAISIAMVDESGPVWIGAIGSANLEQDVDADAKTLFRIASTSKIFVALSILKLVEEGKLSLQDSLRDLDPDIAFENPWSATHPVRLVHLLEHTTGWDEQHYPEFARNDPTPATLKQDIDFHPHSRHSRWPPGARFSYTNSGPAVAARIVENISGYPFEDYVERSFFDPIGMKTATYFLSDDVRRRGVTLYDDDKQPLPYQHLFMRPSGSINASAEDMAMLLRFFLGRGSVRGDRILSERSVDRMERAESNPAAELGQRAGYGLNNYTSAHGQWVYQEHDGGFDGAMSEFAYLPESGLGHALMINKKHPAAFRAISRLIRDYETHRLPKKAISNDVAVTEQHRAIEGVYYQINPRVKKLAILWHFMSLKALRFEGDALVQHGLLGGTRHRFYPVTESLFKSAESGMTSLSRVVDPLEGEVIHDSSRKAASGAVLKRMPTWLAYSQLFLEISWLFVLATTALYFPIWLVRRLRGKIPGGAAIRVRLWPLLASGSIIIVALLVNSPDVSDLGRPSAVSIALMMATASFAPLSLLSVATMIREWRSGIGSGVFWYCAFCSLIHLLMLGYLLHFGVVGVRFWT